MNEHTTAYVLCLENSGYPASLELHKVYRRIADPRAEEDGFVRVVDESGEDYLYPRRFFADIAVTAEVKRALAGSP